MNGNDTGWFASKIAPLTTGRKMLLILSAWLLPLGVIAILASITSALDNSAERADKTLTRLDLKTQRLNDLLERSAGTIRMASAAITVAPEGSDICERTLQQLVRVQRAEARYALYGGDGALRCATPGFAPAPIANPDRRRTIVGIAPDGGSLRVALFNDDGALDGVVEFRKDILAAITQIPGTSDDFDLELIGNRDRMSLRQGYRDGPLVQTVAATRPVAGGLLQLGIRLGAVPISPIDLLMILLPIMMWLGALVIAWAAVERLLLRPLARMQKVISRYEPGDRALDLPALDSPAREIGELGQAFDRVTQTVARHEAELEAAVERQRRLVREVHHRVKNNLQVVASLLNLHSRGSPNEEVAAAYASIQRRVDALAVVHRNHYAELEENRGVALKPLISELGANLRATAPASATGMQIKLDVEPFYVTQDVAVSVVFLVTEIVEFGMLCAADSVAVSLEGQGDGRAELAVESDSLAGEIACDQILFDRFDRIVTGLSRQLRSTLERDATLGRYAVGIQVLDKADD